MLFSHLDQTIGTRYLKKPTLRGGGHVIHTFIVKYEAGRSVTNQCPFYILKPFT